MAHEGGLHFEYDTGTLPLTHALKKQVGFLVLITEKKAFFKLFLTILFIMKYKKNQNNDTF